MRDFFPDFGNFSKKSLILGWLCKIFPFFVLCVCTILWFMRKKSTKVQPPMTDLWIRPCILASRIQRMHKVLICSVYHMPPKERRRIGCDTSFSSMPKPQHRKRAKSYTYIKNTKKLTSRSKLILHKIHVMCEFYARFWRYLFFPTPVVTISMSVKNEGMGPLSRGIQIYMTSWCCCVDP